MDLSQTSLNQTWRSTMSSPRTGILFLIGLDLAGVTLAQLNVTLAQPDVNLAQLVVTLAQPDVAGAQPDLALGQPDVASALLDVVVAQPDIN